jgi:hypothetical protein
MKWLDKAVAKFRGRDVDLTEPIEETPEVTPNRAQRRAQERAVKMMVAKKWTIPYQRRMQRYDNALEAHRRRLARLSPERLAVLENRAVERQVAKSVADAMDEEIRKGD